MKNAHHKSLKPAASLLLFMLVSLVPLAARGQTKEPAKQTEIVASGGTFALEKTVTAGGGNQMSQSSLNQTGTTGQAAAGVKSAGGQFTLHSGFWTPDDFAPTASSAVVGGRILTSSGAGIRNVQVTITFPSGEIRSTVSTSFGYYRFAEIPVGEIYVISVAAKKYTFSQASQIRQVIDDLQDVDFVADE
jgi:hypothetical protein